MPENDDGRAARATGEGARADSPAAPDADESADAADSPTSGPEWSNFEGANLLDEYRRTGRLAVLFASARMFAGAVEGSDGRPEQPGYLADLGDALRIVFERTRYAGALDEAVALGRASAAATPDGHPRRAASLANLARALYAQAERTGDADVLHEAAQIATAALKAADEDAAAT